MGKIKKFLVKFTPLLWIDIRLPFFSIKTVLMTRDDNRYSFTYSDFRVDLFKWNFHISLYDLDHNR
jgi:hypothetical protein